MDYQLVVRIPFSAMDDADARANAKELLEQIDIPEKKVTKLQRLENNAEPIGVPL